MPAVPPTSVSLIRALSDDPESARWSEMYALYNEPMRAFLRAKFPTLDPDDVIQNTMLALFRRIPHYRYVPDENGHFRNYLAGILKHKAADALAERTKDARLREELRRAGSEDAAKPGDDAEWQASAVAVAVSQMMEDPSLNPMHRNVFRLVVLEHVPPEKVAASLGVSRTNVDKIKSRLMARLGEMARRMTE